MNNHTTSIPNNSDTNWYDNNDGPSLHTRIVFASTWIFIAVVGIIGKQKTTKVFFYFYMFIFLYLIRQ